MFLKLQLHSNCLHILSSSKTSPNSNCLHILSSSKTSPSFGVWIPQSTGVSVSTPEKTDGIKKDREHGRLETHDGAINKYTVVPRGHYRRNHDRKQQKSEKSKPTTTTTKTSSDAEPSTSRGICDSCGNNVCTSCSTKWANYGGNILSILQALDTIEALDEAFRPWESAISSKEMTIILKEQSCWERGVQIFQWFKMKGCYELNVIHYNIMLRILGRARQWSFVETLWNEMSTEGISPINSTYGTLIDVYSKGGLKDEALRCLGRMKLQGMEPDEVTMGIVVQMYKKAGEFDKAQEFFKKWSSGESLKLRGCRQVSARKQNGAGTNVGLSSNTYNTLIDTYGKAGQINKAKEIFRKMLRQGIVPTIVTFNTMIHIYGNHGQLQEVASLVQTMEKVQCPPDTRTYNILISLLAKHDDISMAAMYFKRMKDIRLEPDTVSYRTLLCAFAKRHMVNEAEELISEMDDKGVVVDEYTHSALTRMYIEAGMLDKSWLWFRRFQLAGNMSAECYSANIDAYGEHGHILEAEQVFTCCHQEKKLTVQEFNVMLKAYGSQQSYDKAVHLFDDMENHDVVPDKISYNSLILILAGADLPNKAKYYLQKMQEAGLVSDCFPYSAVISSFVKIGKLEMAEELYREMIAFDVKPDIVLYGVLINAFADAGNVGKATSYFDAMRIAGLPGNTVIYNSLIKLYTKVGYLKEAQETYKLLQFSDAGHDAYASNCMIDLYCEQSRVKQAELIFEKLKRKGDANEFTFAMMLCMYKRLGWFQEAVQIAKQMKELGLLTDLLSYNNVLGLYAVDGRFKEAAETFKEMVKAGIQPDGYTFKSLGILLIKGRIPKQVIGKLEDATKKDSQSSLQAWVMALSTIKNVRIRSRK